MTCSELKFTNLEEWYWYALVKKKHGWSWEKYEEMGLNAEVEEAVVEDELPPSSSPGTQLCAHMRPPAVSKIIKNNECK